MTIGLDRVALAILGLVIGHLIAKVLIIPWLDRWLERRGR